MSVSAQTGPSTRAGAGTGTARTATTGQRGGYAKGRATQQEIIRAAILVFADVGFHGASLRDIAARVGISHPGLLHHFPNKAALLEAVLEYRDAVDEQSFQEDMERGSEYFEALLNLVERNRLRRPLVELFAGLSTEATSPDHPAHEYFRRRYARVLGEQSELLRERAARGGLAPGVDPDQAARTVVALMDGLQIQWLFSLERPGAERVDMAADLRGYLNLILR
ncbi:TetR/AcrR family transcriptional regulator [Promicromonospora sp. NPDC060204]|uniref:TetR/AcrR family transcriptional regulator n=1 Tax=Promicromonospora sp. NPDC060204 TaxID=3347071 RepID=UPI00365639AA